MSGASTATPLRRWLAQSGFQLPVLVFALRTGLAAFAALAIAYALGLEHPHWAAMSAWASSQPTREHLLSRGLYRFGGSVVGVAYAVLLVLFAQDALWVLALGLTLWGAACAFLGNLQRGYLVYGCMLAGYSAAMVVLLHHGPANGIWALADDRMLTLLTGVACALAISWWFAPRRDAALLIARSRLALAQVLQAAAAPLREPFARAPLDHAGLQIALARVEETLELYAEGSRTARRTTHAIRRQQHQALELVYQLSLAQPHHAAPSAAHAALATALDGLLAPLRAPPSAEGDDALAVALAQALAACAAPSRAEPSVLPALRQLLVAMQQGLHAGRLDRAAPDANADAPAPPPGAPLPLHRDWVGAYQAAVRAGLALGLVGALWAATGQNLLAFAMLGLSVMLLVFSGFEAPHRTIAFVARGQLIGVLLALACQWWVWPWASSGWAMVALLAPFTVLAALVFAHPRTNAGGMDTNMAMFILLAPVFPYHADHAAGLGMALALLSGPALAWVAYRCVYPTNARHRMRTLARMMVDEVPALAQRMLRDERPVSLGPRWQARLHHRMLRLMRWVDRTGHARRDQVAQTGLAVRAMQTSMLALQQWRYDAVLATPEIRRATRQARQALRRTVQWGQAPAQSAAATKAARAWMQLSEQAAVPPTLAAQARRAAQRDLPALDGARRDLQA